MKKLALVATLLLLTFSQFIDAHELQHQSGGWYTPGGGQISVTVDPCNNNTGTVDFRLISEHSANIYLREDPPFAGAWVWEVSCELRDMTTGQTVKTYHLPGNINGIPAYNQTILYQELTNLDQAYTSFEFDNNHKLIFYFDDVQVQDGHNYQANLTIMNINDPFGGSTTQTNAWTNSININGNAISLGGWYDYIIQSSFTDVSVGDMAGSTTGGQNGYFVGADNRMYNVVWANSQWNIWCLDWNFTQAAPGALAVNQGNGDVFFIGTDGRVYNCRWANNQWNIWCLDWSFTQAAPGTLAINQTNGDVFFIGTDGRVYNCRWANNQWNIWCLNWNFTQAAPGAIAINETNGEVYIIGTDHRVYNCKWLNNQWNIWCLDWNFTQAEFGAITVNNSNGEVYIVGQDSRMYNFKWLNNQWNTWCIDWNFTNVAPGALACKQGSGHVVFIGLDNKLYNAVWANNQWNMWGIDNNYTASQGSLGIHSKNISGKQYDIIFSRDNSGRLSWHYWISCGAAKPGKINADDEMTAKLKYYEMNKAGHGSTTVSDHTGKGYTQLNVYPNPATTKAIVSFNLNMPTNVSLAVYNITGAKVKDLYDNVNKEAGDHQLEFDSSNLPSGIYTIMLQAEGKDKIAQKLIVE